MTSRLLILATFASLILTPVQAQDQSRTMTETGKGGSITLSGTGTIDKAPDMAIVSAGVQSRAKTADEALADNNTKMQNLFAQLEKAGIEQRDIQTANFNIHPEMFYPANSNKSEPKPPQIIGYTVHNQVTVNIRALDRVGSVLTALVNAGSNNMSGLRFDIADKAALIDEARKAAVADARNKANLYAAELGTEIKRLISLSEQGGYGAPPVVMRAEKAMMVASDVPVAEGSMALSITVNTTWELAQ